MFKTIIVGTDVMLTEKETTKLIKLLNLSNSDNIHEAHTAIKLAKEFIQGKGECWENIIRKQEAYSRDQERARNEHQRRYGLPTMPFGKHKGEKIVDIYESDPGYLQWCLNNIDLRPWLKKEIEACFD